ncbi:SLAP domain-containing protein [Pseudalkalibacillus hwajinpoensis]|uniref:SLAP domain-containing protein n=1 Tax=Guptibacillus hwajinpoensis TaxID=208199 RepID=UPI00325AB825
MTLKFEEKWERTISDGDRTMFLNVYENNPIQEGKLQFVPVRAAFNHRDCLLASVIILNGEQDWKLQKQNLFYFEGQELLAEGCFTHQSLTVPYGKAVPWTFIFQTPSLIRRPSLQNWKITI